MPYTIPAYALRTEACLSLSLSSTGKGGIWSSERLFCAIGGGDASDLISSNYSKSYSLLRALYASVCSRFFVYIHY